MCSLGVASNPCCHMANDGISRVSRSFDHKSVHKREIASANPCSPGLSGAAARNFDSADGISAVRQCNIGPGATPLKRRDVAVDAARPTPPRSCSHCPGPVWTVRVRPESHQPPEYMLYCLNK